ncbi:MAG: hypothetical protein DMF96_17270, partial [Acidobacteria bacterium]
MEDLFHTVVICRRHNIGIVDFSYRQAFAAPTTKYEVGRIPVLRVKGLLLLVVTAVVLAGCNGVGEAETSNGTANTPADTTPPSPPTGLTGAAAGSSGANLSWSASTDNVGVTGYIVRRNGVQVATPAATSYTDTGLSAGATYSYTVAARDAAGNISPNSASVSVTT